MSNSTDPRQSIFIKGARVHNLKNIDVLIPRRNLVVITGVSGSGKSSLAFDTLYAEGQRRYIESLSAYARQFMGKMNKPDVDYIKGISPAVAIEQKVNTRNPRSTVGTSTEIYDYFKLLFARIGKTISPASGKPVKRHSVDDVVDYIMGFPSGVRFQLTTSIRRVPGRTLGDELKILLQKGFTRVEGDGGIFRIEEMPEFTENDKKKKSPGAEKTYSLLVDRFSVDASDPDNRPRIADSVKTAFEEGFGECTVKVLRENEPPHTEFFSSRLEADGMMFEEPSVQLFSFNNPYGACKTCEGFGHVIGIDENLVIPNKNLSIYDGAIACWRGEKMMEWNNQLIRNAFRFDFPIHRPVFQLTAEEKKLLWTGNKYFDGLNAFFKYIEGQTHKIQYRVMLSRYRGRTLCPECHGTRLRADAGYVKIAGKSISELVVLPVSELIPFFSSLNLSDFEQKVARRILGEIGNRLNFLVEVGLGYLTLNRLSNTLSGGESQRINLATSLGSSLVGSMYILDEPSIGLHPRDTHRLIGVLRSLRDLGNTVLVVEHEEEVMRAADHIIDIGPGAGTGGGYIVAEGTYEEILQHPVSLTGKYLSRQEIIPVPSRRRKWNHSILVKGARENNLKNIDVRIPLGVMTVVTGVSGSGKTSLIKKVLCPALQKFYGGYSDQGGTYDTLEGDLDKIREVELVDQNPIGRSSRSNPVTYIKAYDEIRTLFADQPMARMRHFKPSHFSFNVEGGRCETCQGEGEIVIEMQFMADVHLVCETCHGKRFREEVLDVKYRQKSIADILDLTVEEAISFFREDEKIPEAAKVVSKLKPLMDVGLTYVKLGQSSSTLSGGEAQRIKLASFLGKANDPRGILFIFDEPTTGLHFHDIKKLLISFTALLHQGHSLVIIEHNPEVIKCADWVIDMGPEGGEQGGNMVFEGIPEDLVKNPVSHTGKYLKDKLEEVKEEM